MKNIFKRVGLIAVSLVLALGSIFIGKSQINKNTPFMASADNSSSSGYTFTGSNLTFGANLDDNIRYLLNFDVVLSSIDNGVRFDYRDFVVYYDGQSAIGLDYAQVYDIYGDYYHDISYSSSSTYFNIQFTPTYSNYNRNLKVYYSFGGESLFNCNVASVSLGNYTADYVDYFNFVRYVDVFGNYLQFSFIVDPITDAELLDNRTYFITLPTGDNAFYEQGVSDGYSDGYADGESYGYSFGYSIGYDAGKDYGYIEGASNANNYTFLGLIGAVVDAPLQVFTSMFNFDLLGVNLRDFFLAILTFCFLTIIVKFALMR